MKGRITTDDAKGIFDRFKIHNDDGTQCPWADLTDFLAVNNAVFTKSWTRGEAVRLGAVFEGGGIGLR